MTTTDVFFLDSSVSIISQTVAGLCRPGQPPSCRSDTKINIFDRLQGARPDGVWRWVPPNHWWEYPTLQSAGTGLLYRRRTNAAPGSRMTLSSLKAFAAACPDPLT